MSHNNKTKAVNTRMANVLIIHPDIQYKCFPLVENVWKVLLYNNLPILSRSHKHFGTELCVCSPSPVKVSGIGGKHVGSVKLNHWLLLSFSIQRMLKLYLLSPVPLRLPHEPFCWRSHPPEGSWEITNQKRYTNTHCLRAKHFTVLSKLLQNCREVRLMRNLQIHISLEEMSVATLLREDPWDKKAKLWGNSSTQISEKPSLTACLEQSTWPYPTLWSLFTYVHQRVWGG